MIALIDNYDSFTYNLARYFEELGESVWVVRNDAISLSELLARQPRALVISPGPCSPNEAGLSLAAIEACAGHMPILGVCLGHQAIAQVWGAQVVRAPRVMHGKVSEVTHSGKGLYMGLPSPIEVTRYHSLIVEQHTIPDDFVVDAWVETDNFGVEVMGMRHRRLPIFGVQFHPESVLTKMGHRIIGNFLAELNS
ncbi:MULTISPECIES: aminodeoxychorismate/anthranilate synthase component II [Idiomarina]|uniref:anthranilate synthase component II n=1 Tax=Idiomarina TaxID=135575 RepID=UPI0007974B82|nr:MULTISPECIES: aminodeoxychorismate/anthranilate synthase component II [Idiomarina]KXS35112.1 MAG: Para-aminobenzoate synthase glutamine amidotransferase, component II [Idiomarina sp. T82-3]MBR37091.1 aminodeoxychorismate/anthranilate synthase component II [Idiomarina sp.]MEC8925736.1 aminodeoxychorismate/anthranilate synthase component II [Pseudomonadota bacterium]